MDSVIIPTHNRRQLALRLLEALAGQCVRAESFEVVVVVDGSTDGTADAVRAEPWPYPLRLIEEPRSGPAAARNRGAAAASGATLVFIDDDALPRPDFLHRMRLALDDDADVVVGFTRVADWVPNGLLAWEQREWVEQGARDAAAGLLSAVDIHFAATAIRRSCFDALAGFDASLAANDVWGNEDTELGYRLLQAGYRVVVRRDIVVEIDCVTDPIVDLRRARALGRSDVRFARKHPAVAPRLFHSALQRARIRRAVGAVVMRMPRMAILLRPLRWFVVAAVARGHAGGLLYRLWLVVWTAEWWSGVLAEGGGAIACRESRR